MHTEAQRRAVRRRKVERKGRRLVGRGRPVNDSVNDFCSSLSEGKVQGQQPIRGPVGLLPSSLCCQGPPSPVSPWEPGSGGQVPRRRPFCPEWPAFLPNSLLGPASDPGTLCQAPRLRSGPGPAGGTRLLSPRPSWRAGFLGCPHPAFVHTAIVASLRTLPAPPPVVLGVGDKGMSQPPLSPPAALRTEGGGAGTGVPRGPGWL